MNASLRAEWLKLLTTRSFYWLTIPAQECSWLDASPAPGGVPRPPGQAATAAIPAGARLVNSPMRRVESPPMMHPWLHAQMRSALTTRTAAFWMPPSYQNGQPRSACRPSIGHPSHCD